MGVTGGRIVARALADEKIPFAFGIPGTHNIELYDALTETPEVRIVLVTDEQSASFMADAVWRASGHLACANVVPGAGLTHAMSGIAEAFMDNVPMLVLGCGIRRDSGKAFQLHDVDQTAMIAPVTKAQFRPLNGGDLYASIRAACRIARARAPGPVFVEVPANLYLTTHDDDLSMPPAAAAPPLDPAEIRRAADALMRAEQPLIYAGLGAAPAGGALIELAERLEAPVATTFQGKGVFPESHPLALWPGFGAAAPPFVREVAARCDATLAIGCKFGEVATASYSFTVPRPFVHTDVDPMVFGRNYPADVTVAGDSALVVPALLQALGARPRSTLNDTLRARIREGHAAVRQEWEVLTSERVSPWRLIGAIQERFGPGTIYCTDSGNGTFLAMEMLRLDQPGKFLAPVDYSCMGYSVPAAIGAKLARPDCPVVGLVGDGAFLMTGLELLTASHLGVAAAFFVLRDRELAQIAQFQDVAMNRKTASILPDYDLSSLCKGLGVACLSLGHDAGIPGVLARAQEINAAGGPVVVDTAIDYSHKTHFTRGVVKTTLGRLPWPDRIRFVARAIGRKLLPAVAVMLPALAVGRAQAQAAPASTYHVAARWTVGGEGGWDYPMVDTLRHRLFLSRGTHVMVLSEDSGAVVGDIPNTPGVHGIAVAPELGKGFISNGRDSSMTVFDYNTLATIGNVKVGAANPDAILYDPFSRRVFTFNGRSQNATAIDATSNAVVGTVPLGGKPEFSQTDLRGRIWVNIEDSSQVAVFDARTLQVLGKYSLAPCEEPSGLAIDREHHRLFAVCSNKLMAVVNTDNGRVIATLPIGDGTDGVAFDASTGLAFAACGEGVVTIVHEDTPDRFSVVATVPTQRGARTITADPRNHRVFTPTAQFQPAPEQVAGQPRQRPQMMPGSFTVVVLEP